MTNRAGPAISLLLHRKHGQEFELALNIGRQLLDFVETIEVLLRASAEDQSDVIRQSLLLYLLKQGADWRKSAAAGDEKIGPFASRR